MVKRGIYNEEGELVEEYYESSEDDWYATTCPDSYCPGNCGICS